MVIKLSKNLKGNLMLVLAAMVWGVSFVMQDLATEALSPFAINGIRSLIGALMLFFLAAVMSKKSGRPLLEKTKKARVDLIVSGVLCGICLCIATNFQQFGIAEYPPEAAASGRAGFLTALYVILVPVFGIFMKKKLNFTVWIGVMLAVVGMALLCFSGGFSGIYVGDIFVICCAVAFALQIICVDKYADRVDGVKLSMIQFLVCGVLSLVLMLIFEDVKVQNVIKAFPYILYLGIMSCGVAYTLQIIGQQYSKNPTVASILMSLESVFAVISGAILIGERMSVREIIGCIVMFAAIVFAQLPEISLRKSQKSLK